MADMATSRSTGRKVVSVAAEALGRAATRAIVGRDGLTKLTAFQEALLDENSDELPMVEVRPVKVRHVVATEPAAKSNVVTQKKVPRVSGAQVHQFGEATIDDGKGHRVVYRVLLSPDKGRRPNISGSPNSSDSPESQAAPLEQPSGSQG